MTAHTKEWRDLRADCRVTLRDWQGTTIKGDAFLSPDLAWLMRTGAGAVFPILPRELIRVQHGAAAKFTRLREGAAVVLIDWEGRPVKGTAREMSPGVWEAIAADGARWLIEPYRLASIQEG
jgi:hypothetical protein